VPMRARAVAAPVRFDVSGWQSYRRTAPTHPARSLLPQSRGCGIIAPSESGGSDDIARTGTNSSTAAVATGATFAPARADIMSAGANATASPPAAELGAEGEKVRLRERVIAIRHQRHRLSMRDRLRHRRRLVEIVLKANGKL
jgi:hypothetical protein